MRTYRIEATVSNDGTIIVKGLPLKAGSKVEIVIRQHDSVHQKEDRYALRGKPIRYIEPLASVAENEWDALAICPHNIPASGTQGSPNASATAW